MSLVLPQSIFAKTPAPHLTAKYVHVNSEAVMNSMLAEGFVVADVKGVNSRDPLHSRHVIDFRHPDVPHIGDAVPRVLFTNSHDGSTRASALAGVFRFVCSNGMVVGSTYAKEKVRHTGDAARHLIERMQALAKNTAPLFTQIESWQKLDMDKAARHEYARQAAMLRWGDPHRFEAEDLLAVRRAEDDKGDLWTVFNRVQEATTRGGVQGYTADGRRATARAINEPQRSVRFNEQLWQLTEEFAGVL